MTTRVNDDIFNMLSLNNKLESIENAKRVLALAPTVEAVSEKIRMGIPELRHIPKENQDATIMEIQRNSTGLIDYPFGSKS